jgi:hypothetical protein
MQSSTMYPLAIPTSGSCRQSGTERRRSSDRKCVGAKGPQHRTTWRQSVLGSPARVTGYTMDGWRLSSNRIQEHVNGTRSAPCPFVLPLTSQHTAHSYGPCSGPPECKYVGLAPHDHSMPTCKVHAGAFCQRPSLHLPRCTFMPARPITKSRQDDNGKPPISRENDLSSSRTRCSIFIF